MKDKYIYYDKCKLINGEQFVVGIEDVSIEYNKDEIIEIISPDVPQLVLYDKILKVGRIATLDERLKLGYIQMDESEFYDPVTKSIRSKYSVPCPPDIKNRVWSDSKRGWVESDKKEDLVDIFTNDLYILLNKKKTLEYGLDNISSTKILSNMKIELDAINLEIKKIEEELDKLI